MTIKDLKHPGLFAAGVLFGTAGIKALSSKDAKKLYTNCTAAVLRAKKVVMDTVTTIQENAEDIYADAKQINEEREAAEEAVEDVAEETAEEAVEAEAEDTVGISCTQQHLIYVVFIRKKRSACRILCRCFSRRHKI